jgi:putative ABC transport system permease protein
VTTLVQPKAPSGMPAGPDRPDVPSSRSSRWVASWQVALRMARRDLRRHKGRSVLVFLMVAIPVGLLAAAATLGATQQPDGADLTTAQMGSGQALVQGPDQSKIFQTPDPNTGGMGSNADDPATPIPGFSAGDGAQEANAKAIGSVAGGTAVPVADTEMRFVKGQRRIRVSVLAIDPRIADVGAKADLSSGRWGTGPDEVVVTPAGERSGLPRSGQVTLSAGGHERDVTVVGTASALSQWGGMPDLVVPSMPADASSGSWGPSGWIITGSRPVSWQQVKELNAHGLTVFSRAVLENPPPASEVAPELQQRDSFTQDTARMIAVIGGVMLFILTTLLVGPAFAVSAARQRRTLALAATNGAEVRQLRRTVLAQAVVLGIISALGGVLLGIALVRVALWWWVRRHPSSSLAGLPFDVPWTAMAILVPCAVLSAVVAALLPSLRLGRLDVIGVMRGQSVSPGLNKVLPVLGAALAAVGALVTISGAHPGMAGGDFRVAVGAIGLVLGVLLVIPALLVLFSRMAARLPVAPRMATRDAARHRSRSAPTVAAILAGVTALTAFSIGLASDTKQQMAQYVPQGLAGEGVLHTGDAETRLAADAALVKVGNDVVRTPFLVVRGVDDPFGPPPGAVAETKPQQFVSAVPSGCSLAESIVQSGPDGRCTSLGTHASNNGFIGVLPAAEIARRLHLDGAQRQSVERGGIVVAVPGLAQLPSLTMVSGTFVLDQNSYAATQVAEQSRSELPVVAVPASVVGSGAMPEQSGAFVTPETARRLGWPTQQQSVLLRAADGGAIDKATQTQLDERLGDQGGLYVERGFQRYDQGVMRVMFGIAAFLILVVTLISTALSMAEQQVDMATFAAVGATRRTRRALAASQAMVVGLVGAVLGVAMGLVPGIAISYPLTAESGAFDPGTGGVLPPTHFLAIPWLPLGLVVVGVPLLAGLLSALAIRKAPTMTRRAG